MAALKILLVDDDPNIRQLLNLYLTKEGYQVEMAERGDTAVTMFKQNPPSIMLLDVMLPGMDGWQVLREVRKVSNIPIIMLTAKDETFDKVLGLELGADDYIVKPFDPKEVTARIKAVCRRFQPAEGRAREGTGFPWPDSEPDAVRSHLPRPAIGSPAQGAGIAVLPVQP